ncbi:MAG: hypothetical protein IPP42_01285 [Saprospiraceae bacterium]|nr:hypothetical protein [Saprospiraceae bacterium]
MTTSLEAINKDGSPLSGDKRWNVAFTGRTQMSMYEVFKSIFFKTELETRIFAFVIMREAASMRAAPESAGSMKEILDHSYASLPAKLETETLKTKVLSIFVYVYHLNDAGQTAELDTSNRLSVEDHCKKSGLGDLLKK